MAAIQSTSPGYTSSPVWTTTLGNNWQQPQYVNTGGMVLTTTSAPYQSVNYCAADLVNS